MGDLFNAYNGNLKVLLWCKRYGDGWENKKISARDSAHFGIRYPEEFKGIKVAQGGQIT